METSAIKYADETDKSFGLAGMAISLMVWDAEDMLQSIDIDAEADSAVVMTPQFLTSQAASAKAVWNHNLRRFQITSAMLVANVACRHMVSRRKHLIPPEADSCLRQIIADEGRSLCELQDDEALHVYAKALDYSRRLFTHPTVGQIATALAQEIVSRRSMPACDVFQILAPLARL